MRCFVYFPYLATNLLSGFLSLFLLFNFSELFLCGWWIDLLSFTMSSNVLDNIIKLNVQSAGRDRIFRLLQYGSRFVWAHLEKYSTDKETINKLKNLESSLGTARKLYRLGRSIDIMQGALKSIHLEDTTLRCTITLSRINMALYFLADHMLWIERVGLATINKPKWSRLSHKLWLNYLSLNLMRDLYEILRIINETCRSKTGHKFSTLPALLSEIYQGIVHHKDITIDTIKNVCDIFIPLTHLGYVSLSPRTIGLLGVISSAFGIAPLLDQTYKLLPN